MTSRFIAICGQSQLFREGLRSLLSHSQFTVVLVAETLDALAAQSHLFEQPVLIIYGLDRQNELPADIACHHTGEPNTSKLVLLADAPTADLLRAAAEAGVHAVLSRNISGEVLQRALDYVLLGQRLFPAPQSSSHASGQIGIEPPPTALRATQASGHPTLREKSVQLSERETQILNCLVEGASNKQIARNLGITEATVKVHIKGLLRKLRVSNRTQAAVWGLHNPHAADPVCDDQFLVEPLSSKQVVGSEAGLPLRMAS